MARPIWGQEKRKMKTADRIPNHIKLAYSYGILKEGWCMEDYLIDAVDNDGYETVAIHGHQGSGKSNRMLQIGAWVMTHVLRNQLGREPTETELWESVLDHLIFKPSEFVRRLEEVPGDGRLSMLLWDDIQAHYTSSTFRTDIDQYQAVDSTFAVIRTKVALVIVTIPVLGRLAKNVKDHISFEVFIGRNQMEQIRRVFYLPGIKYIDSNLFKPVLEIPSRFDLYVVPEWVWRRYWGRREKLTDEALQTLKGATDMEDFEGFMPVLDASEKCLNMGLRLSPATIQQQISRGVVGGRKINGVMCIKEEDLDRWIKLTSRG